MNPALADAINLKKTGQLDAAVIALETVLCRTPGDPFALGHLAEVQLRRNRLDEAGAALDRAEAAAGTTVFTARLRGDLLVKVGDYAAAARAYSDAVALGEKGTWSLVQVARCRLRLKDYDGARGAASEAIEREPDGTKAWIVLGDLALKEAKLDEAETMYGRAHERDEHDGWAYAKLVEVRLLQMPEDRREREIKVLLKTTRGDQKHLLGVLARLRQERGDPEAAAEVWSERASRTGDVYARKMSGFALRKAGRKEEAARILGACLIEQPDDIILYKTYIALQRESGDLEELRRVLEAALDRASAHRRGAYLGQLRKLPTPESAPAG